MKIHGFFILAPILSVVGRAPLHVDKLNAEVALPSPVTILPTNLPRPDSTSLAETPTSSNPATPSSPEKMAPPSASTTSLPAGATKTATPTTTAPRCTLTP